jgi:hypothetical protein
MCNNPAIGEYSTPCGQTAISPDGGKTFIARIAIGQGLCGGCTMKRSSKLEPLALVETDSQRRCIMAISAPVARQIIILV